MTAGELVEQQLHLLPLRHGRRFAGQLPAAFRRHAWLTNGDMRGDRSTGGPTEAAITTRS